MRTQQPDASAPPPGDWFPDALGRDSQIASTYHDRAADTLLSLLGIGTATVFTIIFTGIFVVRDAAYGINGLTNEQLRFLAFPLATLGAALIATNPSRASRLAAGNFFLLLLIAFAALSTFWSVDPSMTRTRSVALILSAIAAIGLVSAFRPTNVMKIVAMAMTVGSALSIILWKLGDPLVHDTEAWLGVRGVFSHKNLLGQCALIGAVLSAGLVLTRNAFDRILGLGMFTISVAALYIAKSATAVVASGVGLSILGLLYLIGQRSIPPVVRPVLISASALFAGIGYLIKDRIVELLGRESNLTGRDEIWAFVRHQISDAPVAGHGFRAFFTAAENTAIIRSTLDHAYDQAHSSILQTLLDLGGIGLAILGLWFVMAALRIPSSAFDPAKRTWLALTAALVLNSFTEALIMSPTGFAWLTLQIAVLSLFASPTAPKRIQATFRRPPQPAPARR